MIVSHQLQLIFVKTKKTAGTSFEIATSKYCGPDDVITPISAPDEKLRTELGYRSAQNYVNTRWPQDDFSHRGRFSNHMSARQIKSQIPARLWKDYTKITIHRNPFDTAISRYYWHGGEKTGMNFLQFIRKHKNYLRENLSIAPLKGPAQCDVYLLHHRIHQDLAQHGLDMISETFSEIKAKSDRRPSTGTSVQEIYQLYPEAIDIIARVCDKEINHFGFEIPPK